MQVWLTIHSQVQEEEFEKIILRHTHFQTMDGFGTWKTRICNVVTLHLTSVLCLLPTMGKGRRGALIPRVKGGLLAPAGKVQMALPP